MTTTSEEIDDIIEELKWGHPETRKKAAIKLGRIRDKRVIPHLIKTLESDEYPYTRVSAIQSLLWIADPSIIETRGPLTTPPFSSRTFFIIDFLSVAIFSASLTASCFNASCIF